MGIIHPGAWLVEQNALPDALLSRLLTNQLLLKGTSAMTWYQALAIKRYTMVTLACQSLIIFNLITIIKNHIGKATHQVDRVQSCRKLSPFTAQLFSFNMVLSNSQRAYYNELFLKLGRWVCDQSHTKMPKMRCQGRFQNGSYSYKWIWQLLR